MRREIEQRSTPLTRRRFHGGSSRVADENTPRAATSSPHALDVAPTILVGPISPLDLAPTSLALLGERLQQELPGRSMLEGRTASPGEG